MRADFCVAVLATIGTLAWKAKFFGDILPRLDKIHADVLCRTKAYATKSAFSGPPFALNPALALHVAQMIQRNVIDIEVNRAALDDFAIWLGSWPDERREKLRSSLELLEDVCPIPGLWARVRLPVAQPIEEVSRTSPPDLEELLERLHDVQISPREWSNLWEKRGWKYFPGEPQLVALARQWLRKAAADPSWPYVWQPLFLYFPEDQQFVDVALWWLEHRGPRDRGAWTFVWKVLWDGNRARDRLGPLGRVWLKEYEGSQHKYWRDVRTRLDATGFEAG